ncbi:MAG: 2-oxo acid dehydrogenase subunit E2 [Phycisphaerales bacterium]|nr:2-oxo acid dehydrogenase subunit E2 [Phycisphaerales bacterium]
MGAIKQPDDQSHFILPDLGEGVHEAELVKWRVQPGETVKEHQTLAEMETDKALVEVPSPWTGVVKGLNGAEGDILKVGSILVTYDVGGGSTASEPPVKQAASLAAAEAEDEDDEDDGTVVGTMAAEVEVSNRFARQPEHDAGADNGSSRTLATPAVRRVARELGIDIHAVNGSGRGGRVTASDVHAFSKGKTSGATQVEVQQVVQEVANANEMMRVPVEFPTVSTDGIRERIPFRGVRRKIAEALDLSVKTAVHFTVVEEVDVSALNQKRSEYVRVLGRKLSLLPFVMDAACKALRKHPTLNANVDDANNEILIKDIINLGCAVDTDHGLMVPNIERAENRSLVELADQVASLAQACKSRTIERERLNGGTFTISNVGSYGGRFATPIINYPEVAILAVGRGFEKVMASEGRIYAGMALPLSLSCDHRVVDGAEGARFLNTVKSLLESPASLLE